MNTPPYPILHTPVYRMEAERVHKDANGNVVEMPVTVYYTLCNKIVGSDKITYGQTNCQTCDSNSH